MKRMALTLVAGAFGTLMVLPMAHAQDMQDSSATVQSEQKTTETNSNIGPAGVASQQTDVQKRTDMQSGDLGATTHKQVDVQKHSDVESNGVGSSSDRQVDVQKHSDVENDALGTSTHQQVDIQKHSDNVNSANTPDANQ
jgi:hypothetical protein